MNRPSRFPLRCVFWMLLLVAPVPARAQSPVLEDKMVGPDLDIKELAKARFEADQATRRDLAKGRRDALNVCFQIREQNYHAGSSEPGMMMPVTLNLLLETWAELVNAELALSDKPDDRLAIQASHWLFTWETERISGAQFHVGRVSRAALLHARSERLADEIKLRERLKDTNRSEPFLMLPAYLDDEANFCGEDLKELAKAQFEASQAEKRGLVKARRDALRACFQERYELYRRGSNEPGTNGPVTIKLLLELGEEVTEAELALSDKPADRLAAQANQWWLAWITEQIAEFGFRVARVSRAALLQARSARLAEEIKVLKLLAREKRSEPLLILPRVFDSEANNLYEAKRQAKVQFEMSHAKPYDLALARRDALETNLAIRRELYLAAASEPGSNSPVTLHLVRESEARLLEAEAAISNKPADRLAAYEKQWEWRYIAELITRRQFNIGRVSRAACERARFERLGAEIQLLEVQAEMNKK